MIYQRYMIYHYQTSSIVWFVCLVRLGYFRLVISLQNSHFNLIDWLYIRGHAYVSCYQPVSYILIYILYYIVSLWFSKFNYGRSQFKGRLQARLKNDGRSHIRLVPKIQLILALWRKIGYYFTLCKKGLFFF